MVTSTPALMLMKSGVFISGSRTRDSTVQTFLLNLTLFLQCVRGGVV